MPRESTVNVPGGLSEYETLVPPYYVKALALGIPALLVGIQIAAWIGFLSLPIVEQGRTDFRHLYTAGYMVRTGHRHELYEYEAQRKFQSQVVSERQIALPFNHLSYEALLFVPFSFLSYRTSYFVFLAFNLWVFVTSFRLLLPLLQSLRRTWALLPQGIFLGFFPVSVALMNGQDSILLLLLLVLALLLLNRGSESPAGFFTGLGLFKFQIVIPIALIFLLWRRWRFFGGFALSALSVSVVSCALVGWGQIRAYLASLVSMSVSLSSMADQFRYSISPTIMPNLRGLIFAVANNHLSKFWVQGITFIASALLVLWVALCAPSRRGPPALALAITAAALVSYHMLIHDLAVLLIPVTLVLDRFLKSESIGNVQGYWILGVSTLLLAAPSFLFIATDWFCVTALPLLAFLVALMKWRPSQIAAAH